MNIEKEIFKKSKVQLEKLEPYGFKKDGNKYIYSKNILNDSFKVYIEIIGNNVVGKIYDLSFNEEYIGYKIENHTGEFVNNIRSIYKDILIDIKNNCFKEENFNSSQANRITHLIKSIYNDTPIFLWPKYPSDGVFKNPNNGKWYGLIMSIKKDKIDVGNDYVDILNIKLDENKIEELLKRKGFYRAYHMNKKKWLTIILDDTISDNEIMMYIEESHKYTI